MRKFYEKQAAKLGLVGAAATAFINNAMAAVDTAAVKTGLDTAISTGETVGGYVIVGAATLVVVGLIIGLVRKL